jgi:hypothetical protein
MSAAQIGLFDQPQPSAGAARRTDPETSKEAAESINAGTLEDQVFRYMLNHGPTILDDVVRDLKIDKETASPEIRATAGCRVHRADRNQAARKEGSPATGMESTTSCA